MLVSMPHPFWAGLEPVYILQGQRGISQGRIVGINLESRGWRVRFKAEQSVYRNFRIKTILECF